MSTGFGEVLRERGMERVRDEMGAFFGAYGEAAGGAIHEGDFDALERSTDAFVSALKEAIPSWAGGETLAKEAPDRKSATAESLSEAGTGQKERTAVTSGATFTKDAVRGTADVLAKQKIEAEPQRFGKIEDPQARLAAARSEVYRENPDLTRLHEQADPEPVAAPEAPVQKGADVLAEANREAREMMKMDPQRFRGKSLDAVRSVVWAENPDLAERYREALR